MKKIVFLACLIAISATSFNVLAQDKKFGIRAGYQTSFLSSDGEKVNSSKSGFYAGVYRDTKIFSFLNFNSGLEYSQLGGSKFDSNDYTLNYVGIPLGLKVKIGPLYAQGGTGFNVKVAESGAPATYDTKWFDIPAYVGAGFNILFMSIEARRTWGLTDIANGLNNNGFQLGLNMRF